MSLRTLLKSLALGLAVAACAWAPVDAADSRANLPKAAAKAEPTPPKSEPAKPARTDDFKDQDNNGVDDRHEKRAIRSEPPPAGSVKPKPDAQEAKPVEAAAPAPPPEPRPKPKSPPGH